MTTSRNDRLLLALESDWKVRLETWARINARAGAVMATVPDWARKEPLARMSARRRAKALIEATRALEAAPDEPWDRSASRAFFRRFLGPEDAGRDRAAERLLKKAGYYGLEAEKLEARERRLGIERQIAETPADGLAGLAVKLRLWWHHARDHASPLGLPPESAEVDEDLLQSIEGDIDRMAG